MSCLYLDTSQKLNIGVYDKTKGWLDFYIHDVQNSSKDLHKIIHDLLEKNQLSLKQIDSFVFSAGPGSYTGIRVSEGIAQVFEMEDFPVKSFAMYKIPSLYGYKNGVWISVAYKGEYFCYSWDKDKSNKTLIKKDDLEDFLVPFENIFTHFDESIKSNFMVQSTHELIKGEPEILFSYIKNENPRVAPIYYRALENEFNVSKKGIR